MFVYVCGMLWHQYCVYRSEQIDANTKPISLTLLRCIIIKSSLWNGSRSYLDRKLTKDIIVHIEKLQCMAHAFLLKDGSDDNQHGLVQASCLAQTITAKNMRLCRSTAATTTTIIIQKQKQQQQQQQQQRTTISGSGSGPCNIPIFNCFRRW